MGNRVESSILPDIQRCMRVMYSYAGSSTGSWSWSSQIYEKLLLHVSSPRNCRRQDAGEGGGCKAYVLSGRHPGTGSRVANRDAIIFLVVNHANKVPQVAVVFNHCISCLGESMGFHFALCMGLCRRFFLLLFFFCHVYVFSYLDAPPIHLDRRFWASR